MDCELLALRHIVTSQVEHSSVLNYCMALSSGEFTSPSPRDRAPRPGDVKSPLHEPGYRVTYLPVDRDGLLLF